MSLSCVSTASKPMEQYPMSGPKAITASPYAVRKAIADPGFDFSDINLQLSSTKVSITTALGQVIDITI